MQPIGTTAETRPISKFKITCRPPRKRSSPQAIIQVSKPSPLFLRYPPLSSSRQLFQHGHLGCLDRQTNEVAITICLPIAHLRSDPPRPSGDSSPTKLHQHLDNIRRPVVLPQHPRRIRPSISTSSRRPEPRYSRLPISRRQRTRCVTR